MSSSEDKLYQEHSTQNIVCNHTLTNKGWSQPYTISCQDNQEQN
jgi:hypothetical protein